MRLLVTSSLSSRLYSAPAMSLRTCMCEEAQKKDMLNSWHTSSITHLHASCHRD
jgi:hypothetical protein